MGNQGTSSSSEKNTEKPHSAQTLCGLSNFYILYDSFSLYNVYVSRLQTESAQFYFLRYIILANPLVSKENILHSDRTVNGDQRVLRLFVYQNIFLVTI